MLKRLFLLAGFALALSALSSAAIPWPPCNPCLVHIDLAR
jgi:hypothetical protein